jgi:prefoldin subunit 5
MTLYRTSGTIIALETRLRQYEEELAQLRSENEYLRRSAQSFGELAERLNDALRSSHDPAMTSSASTVW